MEAQRINSRNEAGTNTSTPPIIPSPFKTPIRTQHRYTEVARDSSRRQLAQPNASAPLSQDEWFTPKGKWLNPEAQKVLEDRARRPGEHQSAIRLRWNVASLIVLGWCSQTGVYRTIKALGLSSGISTHVWSFLEWFGIAVLVFNVCEAMWYLLQPRNEYVNLAMTPNQRFRMGLDSQIKSTSRAATPQTPKMTPSKASSKKSTPASATDIETRRRTPVKGGSTPGSMVTPHSMRSPVSLSAASHLDYSTDNDMLTLTQVLKKTPGKTREVNYMMATPTNANSRRLSVGDNLWSSDNQAKPSLTTPRLPVSRFGINDLITSPLQNLRGNALFGSYQTATPVSRRHGNEGSKGSNKDRTIGDFEYLEPHEVLDKYGVEQNILEWIENMHSWFVRHLLRPLCKQIDELDALFEQNKLGHLSCRNAILDSDALKAAKASAENAGGSTIFGSGLSKPTFGGGLYGGGSLSSQNTNNIPQTLVELSMKYSELPQTKERLALEKYLQMPGTNCRGYIIERVHTLSQSGALPSYIFDGGGSYHPQGNTNQQSTLHPSGAESPHSEAWNPALYPTDAQLLFHLFCTFMDQTLPPVQHVNRPFTDRYVLQMDRTPDINLPAQIVQVARKRPHFCIVVKGSYYDVTANRNNLFVALILFVLQIDRECAGYLGLTNLGGKHVDLLSVIGK